MKRFSDDCGETNTKVIIPITTGAGSAVNQSNFLETTFNLLKAWEKSRAQGTIGFASHWLKIRRESFKPIIKHSYRNRVITFDSHLKTVLSTCNGLIS